MNGLNGSSSEARAGYSFRFSGTAGDNAAMESFFSLLQRNVLDRQRLLTFSPTAVFTR